MSNSSALSSSCCALILAAGKGTRMHSKKPKVLHTILGEPLLGHVAGALRPLFGEAVWAVIGHEADMVRAAFAGRDLRFVEQKEQLGTGHALMVALPELKRAGMKKVLVVNGDTPLITTDTLRDFMFYAEGADVSVATLTLETPARMAASSVKTANCVPSWKRRISTSPSTGSRPARSTRGSTC